MIDQDTTISRQLTLWDQRGSRVTRGNLLVIPIGQSFLYVEPVFLLASGTNIPQLKRGDRRRRQPARDGSDARGCLQVVFGERPPIPEGAAEAAPAPASDAREAWSKADEALRSGDWSAFGVSGAAEEPVGEVTSRALFERLLPPHPRRLKACALVAPRTRQNPA